jgi:hypothetical protein
MDPIRELKTRAELLHTAVTRKEPRALERLRVLPELRKAGASEVASMAETVRLKHCLAIVAQELGFSSWEHARRVLEGGADERGFGTLLYGPSGMLNHWFARYEEARAFVDEGERAGKKYYLLAYKRDFFVADGHFIEAIGLSPDDPDWEAIGRDWVQPRAPEARRRLYQKRLTALAARDG